VLDFFKDGFFSSFFFETPAFLPLVLPASFSAGAAAAGSSAFSRRDSPTPPVYCVDKINLTV
jgi:hypothetical protein